MRSHFCALLKDLSEQMQLPFESHLEASRVRFQVDRAYQFGLGLDDSEQFMVFECVLIEKRFAESELMALLRHNLTAAYQDGCFVSIDPRSDAVVLVSRLPLQELTVHQVRETMEKILNIADRFVSGQLFISNPSFPQSIEFFSKV
jgi:hypothetical protein